MQLNHMLADANGDTNELINIYWNLSLLGMKWELLFTYVTRIAPAPRLSRDFQLVADADGIEGSRESKLGRDILRSPSHITDPKNVHPSAGQAVVRKRNRGSAT